MYCKRTIYRMLPGKLREFTSFFESYILPNHIKNGAKFIGSWLSESQEELITMWDYPSYEEYLKIEQRVNNDQLYKKAQKELKERGKLYTELREDFLTATGTNHAPPKQTVSVSGYITNEKAETLLVKTYWRDDTWELPGGGVDEGETLDTALIREVFEETGIHVKLLGVSGVYSNGNVVSIVFCGVCTGGSLTTSDETKDVRFVKLDSSNVYDYIKRGKFIPRVLDGMNGLCAPYESFKVRPYELIKRIYNN